MTGNDGNNILTGGTGIDTLIGGLGNDTYVVNVAGDIITEAAGAGTDLVQTALANYSIAGFANVENLTGTSSAGQTLIGNAGNNFVTAGSGDDILDGGGAGIDTLAGGLGNDTYHINSATDLVIENANAGIDTIQTLVASYSLADLANIENLTGTSSTGQLLSGNAGANVITGFDGNDFLYGGAGIDTLAGGLGNDILTGGLGSDTFVFNATLGATNIDTITDFSVADDTINLENSGAGLFTALTTTGTLDASAFWTGSAAHAASDRIVYDNLTGDIFYDADGTGATAQIKIATLSAGLALTNLDFVII